MVTAEKPANRDFRLQRALEATFGWNPFIYQNGAVRFRCMNCGCLLSVAPRDTEQEWEHKCPLCGHVAVFNRRPERWGTRHELEPLERMILNVQNKPR